MADSAVGFCRGGDSANTYVGKFRQLLAVGRWFSPVSPTSETDISLS